MRPEVFNTHIHLPPNFSAFDSADDALRQASAEGCVLLGTSNYYDFRVYEPFVAGARERGIYPTLGIEILCRDERAAERNVRYNDPKNPGKVYLCGKGLTMWQKPTPRASELLRRIREADEARMEAMTDRMRALYAEHGYEGPTAADIRAAVAQAAGVPAEAVVLQERHVAEAYYFVGGLDAHHAITRKVFELVPPIDGPGIIRSEFMKSGCRAFVPEEYLPVEEGTELVLELGGLPAYPLVVDGMNPVSEMERDLPTLIARLRELGIGYAEFIPNRNSPVVLRKYVLALWEAGFPVTAGTEHNTSERIPLKPRCKDGSPIPDDVQEIFWRSACIVAGHEQGATGDRETLRQAGEEAIWTYRN